MYVTFVIRTGHQTLTLNSTFLLLLSLPPTTTSLPFPLAARPPSHKPTTRHQWDALLGHCQAVTDFPPSAFADELIEAYPDAKVILHIRPTEKWYASAKSTILSFGDLSAVPLLARPFVMLVGFVVSKWGPLLSAFVSFVLRALLREAD